MIQVLKLHLPQLAHILDDQDDPLTKEVTMLIETFRPPEILYAETSEDRFITLTLNRYVENVSTTDFSV